MAPLVLAMNYLLRTFAIVSKKYGPIICFGLCAFVLDQHRAGVLPRRRDPQAQHRPGTRVVDHGHGPPRQAPLRRLPRARRHHADVPRLGGQRLPEGEDGAARPRSDGDRSATTRSRFDKLAHEEDRQKEMVTGELTALVDGKEIRSPAPREVVLPQPRERADHRGRDQARAQPRTSTSRWATTTSRRARRRSSSSSTRWSTGSGSASCCSRSATGIVLLPGQRARTDDGAAPPCRRRPRRGRRARRASRSGWRWALAARCCWRRNRPRPRWRAPAWSRPSRSAPTRPGWSTTSCASAAPAGTS